MASVERRDKDNLTVKIETPVSRVAAGCAQLTMETVLSIISQTTEELDANEKLLVEARPFKKGSFEIPLVLSLPAESRLFADPIFKAIFVTIREVFQVRKRFGGESIQSVDGNSLDFTSSRIDVSPSTRRVLLSEPVDDLITRSVACLESDSRVTGFSFFRTGKRRSFCRVARRDFKAVKESLRIEPSEESRSYKVREHLSIAAIVFDGNAAWTFIRKDRKLSARVVDEPFLARVRSGREEFVAGDMLDVSLVIEEHFDEVVGAYVIRKATVTEVFGHIRADKQPRLIDI